MERLPLSEGKDFLLEDVWDDAKFQEILIFCQFPREISEALSHARVEIREDSRLRHLCVHAYWELFEAQDASPLSDPPAPPEGAGLGGRLLFAIALLGRTPIVKAEHSSRGIPADVLRETLSDLPRWMRDFRARNQEWGLKSPLWLRRHFLGQLVSLGRLQFEILPSPLPFHIIRHTETQALTALAASGLNVDSEGYPKKSPAEFQTQFSETDRWFEGYSVHPRRGTLCHPAIRLEKSTWKKCASPQDTVLSVHIPAGEALCAEACAASFRSAEAFFPLHYPEHRIAGFQCTSWMLDPQLADFLPPSSNLVRFLRGFLPLPVPDATDAQFFERVFPNAGGRRENLPRATSLQRAVLAHIEAGGQWRVAAGFRPFAARPLPADPLPNGA